MTESPSDAAETRPSNAPAGKKAPKGVPPAFVIVVCLIVLIPYFYLNFFSVKQQPKAVAKSQPLSNLGSRLKDKDAFITTAKDAIDAQLRGKDAWQYHQRLSGRKQSLIGQTLATNEFRFLKEASRSLADTELDAFYQWTLSGGQIYDARLNKFDNSKKVDALIQQWRRESGPPGPR